ncbi:MAG TPA: alanine--tRNA ligase [Sandaracinaceae bacterium LLY-WYZ-13_1]|nr:alanine--tRNA ligase [Sandaracinaceae bacterium LLY-WYZ-13_1]
MMSSSEIRERFLAFFEARGHARQPSGPIVPSNDPSLMFANAGMVQFKDVFTGKETRDDRRAATSQKCIRISGKHNDLENVGVTARHHTFFEMLGNFSFGDYFKEDAIRWGWELLVDELGVDPDKLVVSIFGGEGELASDEEAAELWGRIASLPPERIKRCGAKDNFWQMGDTGPCGPCSEIHYWTGDGAPDYDAFGEEPGPDGKGWVEIWNLVFMQFDRAADGTMERLPAPSIDTGMGLERIACVVQGVLSNYDTDLLRPIVEEAARLSGKTYRGTLEPDDVSMRVIADHARAAAFMMSENITPGSTDRSYVLRRVMRRAIRHGHRLGIEELFFHEAVAKVVELMGDAYPQLVETRAMLEQAARAEEEQFRATLKRGLDLLEANEEWDRRDEQKVLPGAVAFKLYDTFGFPVDLQDVIGDEEGFVVDHAGFDREMEKARKQSQGSKVGDAAVEGVYHRLAEELPATEFLGYEQERASSTVTALIAGGARVERLEPGAEGQLVAEATPFYAESGGQVGDQGRVVAGDAVFVVEDTQKPRDGLFVHLGRLEGAPLSVGAEVELVVDHGTRTRTRRNHSATHLLHWALRKVLGPQAMQRGSLVGPDRLRFDYAGNRPLEPDEIRRIEDLVNDKILANAPIETEVLPMDEAKARGAIGIFEEKYGAVVRMLTMTEDSIELCGGTHASRTGDIGLFKIVSESGLAAGVRRIEAQTGTGALDVVREMERELVEAGALVKAKRGETPDRVKKLLDTNRELQRELEQLRQKLVSGSTQDLTADAKKVGDVTFLGTTVDIGDGKALRELADQLRDKLAPAVVMLGADAKGKALLACSVSKEITERFHAGNLVKEAAQLVGGGGGGRPDFAQAGGKDPSKLAEAVRTVYGAARA